MEPELTPRNSSKPSTTTRASSAARHTSLMSIDVFRQAVGIDDEVEERRAALQAVDEAMAQLRAGQGIPLDEFKRRLNEKHGLPN